MPLNLSPRRPEKTIELAETAYRAYAAVTSWKNFRGDPMPQWTELPQQIQNAWRASVEAVLERTR